MNPYDAATFLHGLMSMYLGYFNGYVPPTFWKALEQSVGERKSTWYFMLGNHRHHQTPPCRICVHTDINEKSCLKSFIYDTYGRTIKVCSFYFKFLAVPTMIKLFMKYRQNQLSLEVFNRKMTQLLKNVAGAAGFFLFGVHCTSRIMCFTRWILGKLQNEWGLSSHKQPFEVISNNNMNCLVILCCVFGRLGALCQPVQRATDVAVASVWQVLDQSCRMIYGIESDENVDGHWLLGSNTLYSFIVALSLSMNIWTYYTDKSCVKGLEKSLINQFLLS